MAQMNQATDLPARNGGQEPAHDGHTTCPSRPVAIVAVSGQPTFVAGRAMGDQVDSVVGEYQSHRACDRQPGAPSE